MTNLEKYLRLPQASNGIQLQYVWIDGNGIDLRCKTRTAFEIPESLADLPIWNYCGQSCGQMELTEDSDCWLRPIAMFRDPFRNNDNKIVLCQPFRYDGKPPKAINRPYCEEVCGRYKSANFTLRQKLSLSPFNDFLKPSKSTDGEKWLEKEAMEAFNRACPYAGVKISSFQNSNDAWQLEIGPCNPLTASDHLWMARFLLCRLTEDFKFVVTFGDLQALQHLLRDEIELSIPRSDKFNITDPYLLCPAILEEN